MSKLSLLHLLKGIIIIFAILAVIKNYELKESLAINTGQTHPFIVLSPQTPVVVDLKLNEPVKNAWLHIQRMDAEYRDSISISSNQDLVTCTLKGAYPNGIYVIENQIPFMVSDTSIKPEEAFVFSRKSQRANDYFGSGKIETGKTVEISVYKAPDQRWLAIFKQHKKQEQVLFLDDDALLRPEIYNHCKKIHLISPFAFMTKQAFNNLYAFVLNGGEVIVHGNYLVSDLVKIEGDKITYESSLLNNRDSSMSWLNSHRYRYHPNGQIIPPSDFTPSGPDEFYKKLGKGFFRLVRE